MNISNVEYLKMENNDLIQSVMFHSTATVYKESLKMVSMLTILIRAISQILKLGKKLKKNKTHLDLDYAGVLPKTLNIIHL